MTMTDPIADYLTRVRNALQARHKRVDVPASGLKRQLTQLLLENKFTGESDLLVLGRDGLAKNGLAVAEVTARAVAPLPGTNAGIVVKFDGEKPGDLTPPDDPAVNPLSAGTPNYNFITLEVVQRIGYDSLTPDNGVLIAKNKDTSPAPSTPVL